MPGRTKLLLGILGFLSLVAFSISAYLTWSSWQTEAVAGCSGSGGADCDAVLGSHWSKWLGLPVSLLGMVTYVGILAICWPAAKHPHGLAGTGLLCLSLLASGAGIWFIAVQAFSLYSFCFYCLSVHACGLTIGALTLLLICGTTEEVDYNQMGALLGVHTPMQAMEPSSRSLLQDGFYPWIAAGTAAAGLALLIVGQVFFAPETMVEESLVKEEDFSLEHEHAEDFSFESVPTDANAGVGEDEDLLGDSEEPEPLSETKSRRISFLGLQKSVRLSEHPLLGSPEAPLVFVEMMDYTCHHCRRLHPYLEAALERYDGQIAFVIHHVPLSKRCNPNVSKDQPGRRNACDYARLAIGVWRLAPEKFPEFHHWLMESEKPPPIVTARKRAIDLAGEAVLIDESLKAVATQRISEQCATAKRLKIGLPSILTGQGMIRGVPKNEEEWFKLIEKQFEGKATESAQ